MTARRTAPVAPRPAAVAMAILCWLAACGGELRQAQPTDTALATVAQSMLGPVSATLTMSPKTPRFGDRIHFVLDVVANEGASLSVPEFGTRLGHFRIRDRKDESDPAHGRLRYLITAEAERTGTNIGRLPALTFEIAAGEGAGTEQQLVVAPFSVEVAGLTPDQQPKLAELGAPMPPVSLPTGRDDARSLWIAAGGSVLALALAWWWWRRRHRAAGGGVEVVDPAIEATRAFDALLAAGLIEQGRIAEFYVVMTGIVRRYIERTTGIHAPEQTTEEFLRAMEGNVAIPARRQRELTGFLAAADLVKFAAQVPEALEITAALDSARAFCAPIAIAEEVAA